MSLPVYEAISFQGVMSGGRTNPWLVLVNENGTESAYVVKLFSEIENDMRGSVVNEVIGNVLAREFAINTPKPALIDIDSPAFLSTVYDPNAWHMYEHSDQRIRYGSKYIFPHQQFVNGAFTKYQIKKSIEIDTLFAFDNLICNRDRGQGKPNILLKDKIAYAIDHELGFQVNEQTISNINNKTWTRGYEYHIFYEYLKRSTKKAKGAYFNEFEEYLKYLPINNLKPFLKQLNHYGYSTKKHEYVLEYLEIVRNNCGNFVQLLQALIT